MSKEKSNYRTCSVLGCTDQHSSLHLLPAPEDLKSKWMNFIFDGKVPTGLPKLIFVCANHFSPECVINLGQFNTGLARKLRLTKGAIPSLRFRTAEDVNASTSSKLVLSHVACQTDPTPTMYTCWVPVSNPQRYIRSIGTQITITSRDIGVETLPIMDLLPFQSSTQMERPPKRRRLELKEEQEEVEEEQSHLEGSSSVHDPAASITSVTEPGELEEESPSPVQRSHTFLAYEICLLELFKIFRALQKRMLKYDIFQRHAGMHVEPAVVHRWKTMQDNLLEQLSLQQNFLLGGDLRSNSPGHSTKFGSYSLLDWKTNMLVDLQVVQCNGVVGSQDMEKESVVRNLAHLEERGVTLDCSVVTERHPQFQKLLREVNITLYYDACHTQKEMPSLKLISATDTQYSISVLKSMNDQRTHGLFCDVTIIIQDKKFKAHKTILSASSTYFHQLFSVAGQVIELNFIKAEIFEEILNYIYTSKIYRVRSDLLEELINAGQILGVKFIANLGSILSQVKGLPGLSKETENKNDISDEVMPIITESFSISAEEFNQKVKPEDNDDSDNDVLFVSKTETQARANQKASSGDVIDLDSCDSENVALEQKEKSNQAVPKNIERGPSPVSTLAPNPPIMNYPQPSVLNNSPLHSPLHSPDSSSNTVLSPARICSGSVPTSPPKACSLTPEPLTASENSETSGVHKKHVSTSTLPGESKIMLSDVCEGPTNIPKTPVVAKKTVTLNTATEIDSISSGCKVYANIGENTYDIVPVKEDPGEGGSKAGNKGKRTLIETPLKPTDKTQEPLTVSPNKKKAKTELEDHYELIMDGKTFYVCIVCKRPYVCLTSLRRHFNTHSWEKKYPCRYCDKVFALAEYRTKHEIHHTGERRYQCLMCNEMFLNYQVLSSHCKQTHNQDPSGRKEKDDTDNNLYRLLPCKTGQMKPYSWTDDGQGVPVISEDGSVHHITPAGDGVPSSTQSRMLNWNDIFIEPNAHISPDVNAPPRPTVNHSRRTPTEFDFVIPETY